MKSILNLTLIIGFSIFVVSTVHAQNFTQTPAISPSTGNVSVSQNQQYYIGNTPLNYVSSGKEVRKLTLQGDSPWLVIKDTLGDDLGNNFPFGIRFINTAASGGFHYDIASGTNGAKGPTLSITGRGSTGYASPFNLGGFHIVSESSYKIGSTTDNTIIGSLALNTNTTARGTFSAQKGIQSPGSTYNNYFAGKIQIGSQRILSGNTDYLLSVDGKITCQKIVCSVNNWADYVFDKDYELMPLPDLEKYIKTVHHLPGIPSETEVKTNGVDIAEMNTLLLKKMEEMTLYIIDLEKRLKQVEAAAR